MTERRTAPKLGRLATGEQVTPLRRLRELEPLPLGTLVLASSNPDPRYFRRVAGGWHACDAHGDTALQAILAADLAGWPDTLEHSDLRRPVAVVATPDELPDPVELVRLFAVA